MNYKNGIINYDEELKAFKLKRNNPQGHNRHTPKTELIGKREHPLRLLSQKELMEERKRCFNEKRYYQTFVLSYSQKLIFIDKLLGLEAEQPEIIEKALKDFEKKEGKIEE